MASRSTDGTEEQRRRFLQVAVSGALATAGCATTGAARSGSAGAEKGHGAAEVTPGEDLMQEHGVVERLLLVYEESARRMEQGEPMDLGLLAVAAGIFRHFVEDYHEKSEEEFVFPRLRSAGVQTSLVEVLLVQHERGRQWTAEILRKAGRGTSSELAGMLRSFTRMYRPHAAQEDTVAFPAFRETLDEKSYDELGEQFEEREHRFFGEHGFENVVAEVVRIETGLGIADLSKFTVASQAPQGQEGEPAGGGRERIAMRSRTPG